MIGHDPLIAMRKTGIKPAAVHLVDEVCQLARDWHAPQTLSGQRMQQHTPCIAIEDKDAVQRLDLRFLVGLVVFVSGNTEARAKSMFEACKRAGASRVIGCHTHVDRRDTTPQWIEIFEKEAVCG
jgi:hypothetical protein